MKNLLGQQSQIDCYNCHGVYHASCVNTSKEDIKLIKEENKTWRCEKCTKVKRLSIVLQNVDESNISLKDVFNLIKELRNEMKEMERNLGISFDSCHSQMDEVINKLEKQEEQLNQSNQKIEELTTEIIALKKENVDLKIRCEDLEQYSSRNDIKIHGIPESKSENLISVVQEGGAALDFPIVEGMIDVCQRLKPRLNTTGRAPILVRFVRAADKDEFMRKRKVKRNLSTRQMNRPDDLPVYIMRV